MKNNGSRREDQNGYKQRAACICFQDASEQYVLLLSSNGATHHSWIIPGGGIEQDETAQQAAVRECYEEAGVKGRVTGYVGMFENTERRTRTYVYTLLVDALDDHYDEVHRGRERRWFPLEDARRLLASGRPAQLIWLDSHHYGNKDGEGRITSLGHHSCSVSSTSSVSSDWDDCGSTTASVVQAANEDR